MNRSHEEIKEMIAAYALGALPEEELPIIRTHILSCKECMEEADEHAETAAALAAGSESVPLSEGFADRVLAAARSVDEQESERPIEPVPLVPEPRSRWSLIAVAASVIALLGFGALALSLSDTRSDLSRTERALQALDADLSSTERALIAVLHSGDSGFNLHGTSGATARVVPTSQGAYLVAVGLRAAPANHDYQLWLIDDGTPVSAGVFDTEDGLGILKTPHELTGLQGAAVSIEPDGGSDQPTTDPILNG